MKTWMTITDLSHYLQIPQSKIRSFIKNKQIPFHDNHGFLRFNQQEIDEWMKMPTSGVATSSKDDKKTQGIKSLEERGNMLQQISYRGKPMDDYILTATIIFISLSAWTHIAEFIVKTIKAISETKIREHGRIYLYREEFKPFVNNFNDYLRVCCQLGLIDNKQGKGKIKYYYPTEYAKKISQEPNRIQEIILDNILNLVRKQLETSPHERHSILLLWYLLMLKERGIELDEKHFKLDKDKVNNYFPLIRLNFAKSLCEFLFNNDRIKEQNFLQEWKRFV